MIYFSWITPLYKHEMYLYWTFDSRLMVHRTSMFLRNTNALHVICTKVVIMSDIEFSIWDNSSEERKQCDCSFFWTLYLHLYFYFEKSLLEALLLPKKLLFIFKRNSIKPLISSSLLIFLSGFLKLHPDQIWFKWQILYSLTYFFLTLNTVWMLKFAETPLNWTDWSQLIDMSCKIRWELRLSVWALTCVNSPSVTPDVKPSTQQTL